MPRPKGPPKTRLSLVLTENTKLLLELLQKRTEIESMSGVVRTALKGDLR